MSILCTYQYLVNLSEWCVLKDFVGLEMWYKEQYFEQLVSVNIIGG